MNDGALQFTKRQLQATLRSPQFWGVLLGIALLIGLIGPFGTFALPLLPRLGYWLGVSVVTWFVAQTVVLLLVGMVPRDWPLSSMATAGLAGAVAGLPVALVVWVLNLLVIPERSLSLWQLLAYCVALTGVISLLGEMLSPSQMDENQMPPVNDTAKHSPMPANETPLLQRLPPEQRGSLLYLSMQDHYVEVHTERGKTLLLLRLADAIRETGAVEGVQIHRSHWVARTAVRMTRRRNGRLWLVMSDGAELPVSRSGLAAVRAAGLDAR